MLKQFFLGVVFSLVVACSSLTAPKSFDQQIAYTAASLTAIADSTTDLMKRGRIPVSKSAAIEEQLENASLILSNARIAKKLKDDKNAVELLNRVNQILIQLEQQLKDSK